MERGCASWIFGIFLLLMPTCFIHEYILDNYSICGWLESILFVVIFIGVFLVLGFGGMAVDWSSDAYRDWKRQNAVCSHGIRSGRTKMLCEKCMEEEFERKRLAQEEKLQREIEENNKRRKTEIYGEADKLRISEVSRMRKSRFKKLDFLINLDPNRFEDAVAEMFSALGYKVEQTPYANDFGKDAVMIKENNIYVLECKRYARNRSIGRPPLQKFFAAMIEENAEKGFFVTTSYFTKTAEEYASKNRMELINGETLAMMMSQAFPAEIEESVNIMCLECGQTVNMKLYEKEQLCPCGHHVLNNISEEDLERLDIQKEFDKLFKRNSNKQRSAINSYRHSSKYIR